jgi:predicted nuclease with TOPRIM domain
MSSLKAIEDKLDYLYTYDPTSPEIEELEAEADALVEEQERLEAQANQYRAARAKADKLKQFRSTIESKYKDKFDSYPDWEKWAFSLYTIDENFKVTSTAKNWDPEKGQGEWFCSDQLEALEKIEQLVAYKYYDYFVRSE